MEVSRDDNGNIPILYIEIENEPPGEAEEYSGAALIGPRQIAQVGGWRGDGPRPRAVSARRLAAAGVGTVLALGALTGVSLAAQAGRAQQRAVESAPMALVSASYAPDPAGNGYDLTVALANNADVPVTLLSVGVNQPGLTLVEGTGPITLAPRGTAEIVVGGWFDCAGPAAPDARTVAVTVGEQQESLVSQHLALPATARLPDAWLAQRTSYCGDASADQGPATTGAAPKHDPAQNGSAQNGSAQANQQGSLPVS